MVFKDLIREISNAAINSTSTTTVPSDKQLYEIDLNTRAIQGPSIISVQDEHYAETVYFLLDRYYGNMDLAQTNCIINYVITDTRGQEKYYTYEVPYCDCRTIENKIILPWCVSFLATQNSGIIKYYVSFYLLNDENQYTYKLNTTPSQSEVLITLPSDVLYEEENILKDVPTREVMINQFNQAIEAAQIFWIDV